MTACHRIDRKDADGRLDATGVEWTEHCMWCDVVVGALVGLSFVAGMFAAFAAALISFKAGLLSLIPAGAAVVLFSPILWRHELRFDGKTRQLLFHRDGRMEVPFGLPFYPRIRLLTAAHTEVASLEIRQTVNNDMARETAYSSGVAMMLRSGDIVYVAKHLHPDDAQKVAVQLTLALAAMRDDLAAVAARPDLPGPLPNAQARKGPKVEAMID